MFLPAARKYMDALRSVRWMLLSMQPFLLAVALSTVIVAGGLLRFQAINWDSDQHLHPDERFITMVATAIEWPPSLAAYFDTAHSPLNPYNRGFGSYAYGTFPLFLTRWVAQLLEMPGYDGVHLVGRALSGLMDLLTIVLIFFTGQQLYGTRTGLLAALLLAFSVFNIQQSHFFTADMPANLMVVIAMLFAIRVARGAGWGSLIGLGVTFGLAIASKLNLALFGLVVAAALAQRMARTLQDAPPPAVSSPPAVAPPPAVHRRRDLPTRSAWPRPGPAAGLPAGYRKLGVNRQSALGPWITCVRHGVRSSAPGCVWRLSCCWRC